MLKGHSKQPCTVRQALIILSLPIQAPRRLYPLILPFLSTQNYNQLIFKDFFETPIRQGGYNESMVLVTGNVFPGHRIDGNVFSVLESLRKNLKAEVMAMMLYLTAAISIFLFVYLSASLVRPEWF
jgi:hypothetical protein